ncbi:hypothetical protein OCL06_04070 [Alteromonas sp. ASW11-19]|uniref:Uncharacterized protein n=1 Tax=Alteromonas salexigens TaxID=2982530 RepID=A0ABT2VKL5_9ALTE|nr:hypothetical protein [Alteromonas salexigens]MCU7553774.1 hypothetical protein [Alteromonas salexigens]
MEEVASEVGKGLFRIIVFVLLDILFWAVCYWVGYPICKLLTLGQYPQRTTSFAADHHAKTDFWCAAVGLLTLLLVSLSLMGAFA